MSASKRLATLVMFATATTVAHGCDDDGHAQSDDLDVTFRNGGDRDGPGKLNTSFMGDDELLPLDNVPLAKDAEANVELLEIRSDHCLASGVLLSGEFTTAFTAAHLDLSLSETGHLGSIRMTKTADPLFHCTLEGNHWEDTHWDIRVTSGNDIIETDLWLTDLATDSDGYQLYEWFVNYLDIDPNHMGEVIYFPTCDEDLTNTADPGLSLHAYMVKDLHVDPTTGDFSSWTNTMYMACLSGAVGKAMHWGYKPDTGHHELGSRMVRADYCGDGQAYTTIGTEIWLKDNLNNPDNPPAGYTREAKWSLATGRASCLDTARLGVHITCSEPLAANCNNPNLGADIITYLP